MIVSLVFIWSRAHGEEFLTENPANSSRARRNDMRGEEERAVHVHALLSPFFLFPISHLVVVRVG
jgi:hypothetical protein